MKLLLAAALRSKKHFFLAFFALSTLFLLTVADSMERISIGVIVNRGTDFFTLFSEEKKDSEREVSHAEMEKKWQQIDSDNSGVITQRKAENYLAKQKSLNFMQRIFYEVSAGFDLENNFSRLILLLLCIALFKAVILFTTRYSTQVLAIRVARDLRGQYFEHIQSLPLSFYQSYNLGSLSTRAVGDAGQIASSLNSCLVNYFQTPFTIVSALLLCFLLSWQLSMIIFVGLPLVLLPALFFARRVKRVSRQIQKNQENFASTLIDFLSGILMIKSYAMEAFSLSKYQEHNNRVARLECKSAKYSLLTRPVLHTVTTCCLAIVILVGLTYLHMSVAQLIVFCGLLHLFYEPVKKFAELNADIQKGVAAAERMFEVLEIQPTIQDHKGAVELKTFSDVITFDKVSFRYNDAWVLQDLSFQVKKGETLAIVGPTGGGKSTILQLLPRLYDVQNGEIRIDGISLVNYTQKSLREQIAYVSQKPFLFYDTAGENIAFGRSFPKEKIIAAAKKAHADEFISQLPQQYDTLINEGGKNLSGGQQQRITIARALLKEAPILMLDEATSSLDAISESLIYRALKGLHGKVTQIIVAHRLSTIAHADRIIYLEEGRKIAEGTKEELLKSSPEFRLMWQQFHRKNLKPQIASEPV